MIMIQLIYASLALGISAGFSPGPLSTLVITQTLRFGTREGLKTALAPILTDGPIIIFSLLLLSKLSQYQYVLAGISFAGAVVVFRLAYLSFKAKPPVVDGTKSEARSYFKGMIVNFLSPNPYLFWLTVGAPTTVKAWNIAPVQAVVFLTLFYTCLIAGKMLLAAISGKAKSFLTGKGYSTVMRILGLLLIYFAITLISDGIKLL